MNYERMALAFFEAGNDLSTLRLVIDDTLEMIAADKAKPNANKERLELLERNLNRTRLELSSFRALCNVRIDECSPGIQRRMADRVRSAFEASERAARGEPA